MKRFLARFAGILALMLLCVPAGLAQRPNTPRQEATPATDLATLPGFQVERLLSSDAPTQGSWINMTKDNKGRLIIGGQGGQPVLRVTLEKGKAEKIEKLNLPISETMGLLYAFDSLYVNGSGPNGYGLYRCRDTKETGQFDDVKPIQMFNAGGEHGAHAVILGPDQKLYVICGNHTPLIKNIAPDSPHKNYQEDQLLPRQWDGNGHATGIMAPGGHVYRTDPEGKKWELVLAGFRNAYDIAFNADGELFTFDSDMEWDWGMPWYRPIRVNHCTSASEFGWRSGTGKWPAFYPDSLGAVVNIGVGSPTGVIFGTGAKFPAKYQKAFYVLDWSYGRVIAVHLKPEGSGYTATFENLVSPKFLTGNGAKKGLTVTDVVIGDDGALYFTTGGRNTQSGLYRVTYTGTESTSPADLHDQEGAEARKTRHEIEAYHGKANPKAVEAVWPYLKSEDRNLRYAARIALESQPVAEWKSKALEEKDSTAAIYALLALARTAPREVQPELLTALGKFPLSTLSEERKLDKLRVLGLSFIRQGQPSFEMSKKIIDELEPLFPSNSENLNHELARVLIYLNSPKVLSKCLKLMAGAKTQEDMIFYLFNLRTLPIGFWTLDQRKEYLSYYKTRKPGHPPEMIKWFEDVGHHYSDGASYGNFMSHFLTEAVANMSDAERKELEPLLESINKAAIPKYDVKPHAFVKAWKTEELITKLDSVDKGRNFDKGRDAYLAGQCIKCHRMSSEGGAVGPDLTAIANRFSRKDILESIIEPSKVISDQYQNEIIETKGGQKLEGRVVDDTPEYIAIQADPLSPKREKVRKDDIEIRKPSKISPMPEHLVDILKEDEILDLIAYLESGGNKGYRSFKK